MKIEFNDDGSCWIEIRAGRSRWFGKDHEATKAARRGLILDGIQKTQRAFASGTHEPVIYYRDENGINLPPDPSAVPAGAIRMEIKSLREADALAAEMTEELRAKWQYDATEDLDRMAADVNGRTPRELVVLEHNNAKTDYGRAVTAHMIEELDQRERERRQIDANVHFHWREYDR